MHDTSAVPTACVVMGVSGTGKSSVAAALAEHFGLAFVEGDSLHDAAAVQKMRSGQALTDDDRWPWLARIGAALADRQAAPRGVVVSCSALRRAYRDTLRAACPGLRFIFLDGSAELIASRMAARQHHYMPTSLLHSQLQTLQRPDASEADVTRLDIEGTVPEVTAAAIAAWTAQPRA
jgi:gluconokinase